MIETFDPLYAEWQHYWQQLATLKKRHQPNYAPIEEWAPLEAKCKEAFKKMMEARRVGLR